MKNKAIFYPQIHTRKRGIKMKSFIIIYLISLFILTIIISFLTLYNVINFNIGNIEIGAYCFYVGIIGGITHCLRSVYLHASVLTDWDSNWNIWYFLRPLVSGIMGAISFIFIKAGLFAFSSEITSENRIFAFLAISFLAGYNVKNFLIKIEDISKTLVGIDKKTEDKKKDK